MTIRNLYKYTDGNKVVVTPTQRQEADIVQGYRLIADEGMILVKGDYKAPCIDIPLEQKDEWQEIEDANKTADITANDYIE